MKEEGLASPLSQKRGRKCFVDDDSLETLERALRVWRGRLISETTNCFWVGKRRKAGGGRRRNFVMIHAFSFANPHHALKRTAQSTDKCHTNTSDIAETLSCSFPVRLNAQVLFISSLRPLLFHPPRQP